MKLIIKKWIVNALLMVLTSATAVAIGSQLPQLYGKWRGTIKSGDFSAHVEKLPHRVTLYGTTTCPHCKSARDYLKRSGVAFNDQVVDQSKTVEDAFRQLNEKSVPVLVSEHKLVVGFKEKEYDELIKTDVQK
nr:glutaredoxin domain-containing protein [Rhodoferax sp.]